MATTRNGSLELAIVLVIFITSLIFAKSNTAYENREVASAPDLNHMVVDKNTGYVYVGALNRLLKLSPDLIQISKVETGPRADSTDCDPYRNCPPTTVLKQTDNVNKALVIDYKSSQLIACGSIFQGSCSLHSLHNISHLREVKEPVVSNDASASTVAFVGPGPNNGQDVLYVAVTFTGNSPYRSEVPAVSSRSLENSRLLDIAHTAVVTGTRMFVNSLARERYLINYLYGFSSQGFSYFLTTQPRDTSFYRSSNSNFSKIVRVCHGDENYYSYTELPIVCTGKGNKNDKYNLIQAAYVGKVGLSLADEMNITTQDDVLFTVFSKIGSNHTKVASNVSAMCLYSMKAIRRKFLRNIKKCFDGKGSRGLDFISPAHKCLGTVPIVINEEFCGVDVNTPLGGTNAVKATSILEFNIRPTAVVGTPSDNSTVVFIGTNQGHLKKIIVQSLFSAHEKRDIIVDKGSPVNKDLHFDNDLKHLYVMTEKSIFRIQDCIHHDNCTQIEYTYIKIDNHFDFDERENL